MRGSPAAWVVALVCLAGDALAGDVEKARALFAQGVKLYQGGDYAGARQRFAAAEQEHHSPVIVYNLALSEERLGRVQAAVDGYEKYIAEDGEKGEFSVPASIAIAQLKARSSRVRIQSVPPGVRVYVDGSPLEERTPTVILLAAGTHHVVVESEGFREEKELIAMAGRPETLLFTRPAELKPDASARPPPPRVPDPPRLVPRIEPPPPAPDGFVFGTHFIAIAYAFFKNNQSPTEAQTTGASVGATLEVGYAFTPRAEILLRALGALGSECPAASSNFLSLGPALSFRITDWGWLGVGLLGGQARNCDGNRKPLETGVVFSPTLDFGVAVATRPYGQWLVTASIGYYFANPTNDNRVLYAPVGFGLRFF